MENVKKQLLLACINHGVISFDLLKTITAALCDAYDVRGPNSESALKKFVAELDSDIKKYEQCLQFVKHPLDGVDYLVFGLLISNQACKYQPHYTDTERKYFYKLLETLVSSEDYGIEWTEMYTVANQLPANAKHPLSKQRIQDLENVWTTQGYFLLKNERIYIGPRTMVEYGNYMKNNFKDYIKDCKLCQRIVYWDVKCSECETKFHRECIRKYLIKKSTCPHCKKTWNTRLSQST